MHVEYLYGNEGHFAAVYALAIRPDTNDIYSGGGDGYIIQWKHEQPNQGIVWAQIPDKIFYLHANEYFLFAATISGDIYQIPFQKKEELRRWQLHKKPVYRLMEFDRHLLAISRDGLVSIWSLPEMQWKSSWQISINGLRSIAINLTEKILFIGDTSGNIFQYQWPSLELLEMAKAVHQGTVFSLWYDDKRKLCISGGLDARLKFHSIGQGFHTESSLNAHWFAINDMKGIYNDFLLTASRDKNIRLWNLDDFSLIKDFSGLPGYKQAYSINTLAWLGTENVLFSAGDDKKLHAWKISKEDYDIK
jgi:WD40 repeat protein